MRACTQGRRVQSTHAKLEIIGISISFGSWKRHAVRPQQRRVIIGRATRNTGLCMCLYIILRQGLIPVLVASRRVSWWRLGVRHDEMGLLVDVLRLDTKVHEWVTLRGTQVQLLQSCAEEYSMMELPPRGADFDR